jgi:cytochrome c peroxidase
MIGATCSQAVRAAIGLWVAMLPLCKDGVVRADDRAMYAPAELAALYGHSPLGKPPADPTNAVADKWAAARLGRMLFFDRRLSDDGRVGCSTCHQPEHAFTDGRRVAVGLGTSTHNTPTLLNEAFGSWFFWDGRADSLWSQALQPLENPREAGADRLHVLHVVRDDPALREAYESVFGALPSLEDARRFPPHALPGSTPNGAWNEAWSNMTQADRDMVNRVWANLGKAIEAYERRLVRGGSAFDQYVAGLKAGDVAAQGEISAAAKRGLQLFVGAARCELCHAGPLFTDGQFHNLGLPLLPGEAIDTGREFGIRQVGVDPFNSAGAFSDAPVGEALDKLRYLPEPHSMLGAFKTPSLRNVALTGPYMHDGRFATLAQVLDFYAQGRTASQGRTVGTREKTADLIPTLDESQKQDLVAFLQTLTSAPLQPELTTPP